MDMTVAKSLRAVLGAILRDELNIYTFLFEESSFTAAVVTKYDGEL